MTKPVENGHYIEAEIFSLATMPQYACLFLSEINGNRVIPLWIGQEEADSIRMNLSGILPPRPLAHDLISALIKKSGFSLRDVCINDVDKKVFFAYLFLQKKSGRKIESFKLDARPSDAIAVALRYGCPIFIHENVFEKARVFLKPISEEEVRKFKTEINNLKPSDIIDSLSMKKSRRLE